MFFRKKPIARALMVGWKADPVLSPIVHYGNPLTSLLFPIEEECEGRVTFEKLDALRVCRGEYAPYGEIRSISWVAIVEDSPWLRERYEYESKHYRNAYEFDGDVREMLRDFRHYLFAFHDEFVEAIAAGIWLDVATGSIDTTKLPEDHPLLLLPQSATTDHIHAYDLVCEVRESQLAPDQLAKNCRLCSQPLLDFALVLDGSAKVSWRLSLRQRDGQPISVLRSTLGRIEAEFGGIADLATVRLYVERWMREVSERRQEMGK